MFRFRQIAALLLALALAPALLWGAPQKGQKPHTVRVKASAQRAPDPVVQPPAPPAPPPTLEQQPAQPPQVSFLNGQLTIISRNSTLGDILRAVARQTGAVIELPPGAGFERVAGRMGPGPARNVLAELLNGSRYDYVMVAAASSPGGLQHVILTPKAAGGVSSPAPAASYQPPAPEPQVMSNQADMPSDANPDEEGIPPEQAVPPEQPDQQPPPNSPVSPDGSPQANGPSGVKTPEQLLQELQRMQQQQQQQQQNQPPQ